MSDNTTTKIWYGIGIVFVAACSGLLASSAEPVRNTPLEEQAEPCECVSQVEILSTELEDCREQEPVEVSKAKVRTRTVEKQVQVPGPPKKCAIDLPNTKPINSTTCQPGYLCLDDESQASLLYNELAYRSWVEEIRECERE